MYIYTAEDVRDIDGQAERQGFSLFALMENAGRQVAETFIQWIEKDTYILILAGRGNNGGDGIVLARYLKQAGYQVELHFPLGGPKTETAQAHLDYYRKQGFDISETLTGIQQPAVIIDALLGIGSHPPLRQDVADVVRWANEQSGLRYAIDIPTGVSADHGSVEAGPSKDGGTVFQADVTFVLHGAKPSTYLLPSSQYYGQVIHVDIGLKQDSPIKQTTEENVQASMPKRHAFAHKGSFGTTLLFAGSDNMPGSALLTAIGAIRCGTGKLVMGTTTLVSSVIAARIPEATFMVDGINRFNEQGTLPPKTRAIGIGPGLEDTYTVEQVLDQLMQMERPLVVDAGALLEDYVWKRKAPTVLTPHPGEFSKLTGLTVKEIQANRITVAREYAQKHDVILVLKGQYTVIAFPNGDVNINPTGNSGLAKGGSGDVLTGMITSMLSYYDDFHAAVINAVYLHGLCADIWAETNSETTLTASDFHSLLPKVFRRLE